MYNFSGLMVNCVNLMFVWIADAMPRKTGLMPYWNVRYLDQFIHLHSLLKALMLSMLEK